MQEYRNNLNNVAGIILVFVLVLKIPYVYMKGFHSCMADITKDNNDDKQ